MKLGVLVTVTAGAIVVASATFGAPESAPSSQPSTADKTGRPTLTLADANPLRLRGARFAAGERVRVTVDDGDAALRKTVTAGPAGGFAVSFAGVATCSLTITAVGDKGSRASFQLSSFVCD